MRRILVTGAKGFVGSQLCCVLSDSGYQVRTALRQKGSCDDLAGREPIVIGDIGPNTQWEKALCEVDCVVHLAARVHVMDETSAAPLTDFRIVNFDGTINLARQAIIAGVKRLIYLSSIKVNGEKTNLGSPFKSDDSPAPIGPYAISKFETEKALLKLADITGIEVVIIRPPLVYGPGVKANFLRMMQWLEMGIPLPFGAIHNKRSLVSLDNLVSLIVTCIEHRAASSQTFLAGDGEDLSTTELLQRLGRALGAPARLIPFPVKLLDFFIMLIGKQTLAQRLISSLQVDISKTSDLLGWKPVVSVDEALKKTAKFYQEARKW